MPIIVPQPTRVTNHPGHSSRTGSVRLRWGRRAGGVASITVKAWEVTAVIFGGRYDIFTTVEYKYMMYDVYNKYIYI